MFTFLFNIQSSIQCSTFSPTFNYSFNIQLLINIQLFIQYSTFYLTFNYSFNVQLLILYSTFLSPHFFWSVKTRQKLRTHNRQMVIGNMKNRSFPRCGRRRKDHKVEENLRRLSHCLNQASEVVQQLVSATSNSASNSAQTMVSTSGGMTSVSQAVGRTQAMMHQRFVLTFRCSRTPASLLVDRLCA